MKKKFLPMLLSVSMIATLLPVPVMAATTFEDVQGHWGERAIERWVDYGIVNGDKGQFRPDDSLTRGEMAVIIANLLNLENKSENNPFSDLDDNWYTDALLACYEAGIFSGDAAGTIRPNDTITRQEAMVVLCNAMRIAPKEGSLNHFNDGAAVADWAVGFVKALTDAGIVNGVGDNMLQPNGEISRASVVTILNNAITVYANQEGQSVEATGGIAIVASKGVTVTGAADYVLVLDSVAAGKVTLDDLKVNGEVTIEGQNTQVILAGETTADDVVVADSADGAVLTVDETAEAGNVTVGAAHATVDVKGKARTITVNESAEETTVTIAAEAEADNVLVEAAGTKVTVDGDVENISLDKTAEESKVTVSKDAHVDSVKTDAPKTDILVQGQVSDVTVSKNAAESTMKVESTGKVTDLNTSAEKVTVSGNGTVENATVSGDNTAINTDGTKLEVDKGTEGVTENGTSVDDGNKVTTGDSNTSGGSSSSGSSTKYYTVTFNLTDDEKTYTFSESIRRGNTTDAATAAELGYTLEEGKQITWYDANGNVFDFANGITGATTLTGVVGSNAFAGGDGTEAYPYLISNGEELVNISTLSDEMKPISAFVPGKSYHFQLLNDITVTDDMFADNYYITNYFSGTFDGNNKTIVSDLTSYYNGADAPCFFIEQAENDVTIKNLTIEQSNYFFTLIDSSGYETLGNSNVTFENITINNRPGYDELKAAWQNHGSFIFNHFGKEFNMINVTNNASYKCASNTWTGVFLNGYATEIAEIRFDNCKNTGNIEGHILGLLIGNSNRATDSVTVTNCTNTGVLLGGQYSNLFANTGNTGYEQFNTLYADDFDQTLFVTLSSIDGIELNVDENGYLVINDSTDGNYVYEIVMQSQFAVPGGSDLFNIVVPYNESGVTDFKYGTAVTKEKAGEYGFTEEEIYAFVYDQTASEGRFHYTIQEKNGVVYYIFDLEDGCSLDNEHCNYTLNIYKEGENGKVLCGKVELSQTYEADAVVENKVETSEYIEPEAMVSEEAGIEEVVSESMTE